MRSSRPSLAIAILLLAVVVHAGPVAVADTITQTPLPADVATLGDLVKLAANDLAALQGKRSEEDVEVLRKTVNGNLRAHLQRNLVNLEGEPFLGPAWTHYLREGRHVSAYYSRVTHVKACPICNATLAAFGRDAGVTVPPAELPFDVVVVDKHWYRVRPPEGYLFEIADLTRGTTSVIPRGRVAVSSGRWWAVTGWLWTGPIEPPKQAPVQGAR